MWLGITGSSDYQSITYPMHDIKKGNTFDSPRTEAQMAQ